MSDKYFKYFSFTAGGPSNDDVCCQTCKAAVKRKYGNTTRMRNHLTHNSLITHKKSLITYDAVTSDFVYQESVASEVDLFLMDDQVTEDENFNWEPLNPRTASPTNLLDLELVGYLADDRLSAPTPNKDNSCDVMNYSMKKANKFPNISRMARKYLQRWRVLQSPSGSFPD
ncbi:hypothetical protein L596_004422 [Steinernema carpocapsae]|uniref:BED-type domain-containing protein n=1 Tax=Steinernema carpocapsae TaxID=34508 RepID=A0A4U8UVV5_STECR|nr:hypothetical protein L596_004422 [Steinernema carpocapsae]